MDLLESIIVETAVGNKSIELYHGDLTNMRSPVDLLIISAGRKDYIPTPGSLIGALHRHGVVVAQLEMTRELDLRRESSCWLSAEINTSDRHIKFKRILCFEPTHYANITELTRMFFQAIVSVLSYRRSIKTAAMPIVFSGGAGLPVSVMAPKLVNSAKYWMAIGLPLERLKIVVHNKKDAIEAANTFLAHAKKIKLQPPRPRTKITHDIFVSYAHTNDTDGRKFVNTLREKDKTLRIFIDREHLRTGAIWQHQLLSTIDSSHRVVALLSPEYIDSLYCLEEYHTARLRGNSEQKDILWPVYLYSARLPTYMSARQWVDCREGDIKEFKKVSTKLLEELKDTR